MDVRKEGILTIEEWRNIEKFSEYRISSLGRVKSLKYNKERILKPAKCTRGFLFVTFTINKKKIVKQIHRLMLEVFKPKENSDKYDGFHKDKNKENNYIDNLEWRSLTRSEYMKKDKRENEIK
jgi:hypothetical protein